jgi:hypothetical protein
MSLPGFTAEKSLYRRTERFRSSAVAGNAVDPAAVIPQVRPFVYTYECASMADGSVGYCTIVTTGYAIYFYGPF